MAASHSQPAIAQAYASLSDRSAVMYRILGLIPRGSLPVACAAAAAGVDTASAAQTLHELTQVRLVEGDSTGYRMPRDVGEHARSAAVWQVAGWGRGHRLRVLLAILRWYVLAAHAAAHLIMPARRALLPSATELFLHPAITLPELSTKDEALRWAARERHNVGAVITAAADNHDQTCLTFIILLADALQPARIILGGTEWAIQVDTVALAAARELGQTDRIRQLLTRLARAYSTIGDHSHALRLHEEEMTLAHESEDRLAVVSAVKTGGLLRADVGDWTGAIAADTQALQLLHQAGGARPGRKEALLRIKRGHAYLQTEHEDLALTDFHRACSLLDALPTKDDYNRAIAETGVAKALTRTRPEEAERLLDVALTTMEAEQSIPQQLDILDALEVLAETRHDSSAAACHRSHAAALRATVALP